MGGNGGRFKGGRGGMKRRSRARIGEVLGVVFFLVEARREGVSGGFPATMRRAASHRTPHRSIGNGDAMQ